MPYMAMEKTTLYIPAELQAALREHARRSGRPQAELIRAALEQYLTDLPHPELLSIGLGSDEEVSARDSEDWLRKNLGQR